MVTSNPPCPSCGVAVLPGYMKCPRCHAEQPRARRTSIQPGGTAVVTRDKFPIIPIVGGVVVAVAIALFFGMRRGHATSGEQAGASDAVPEELTRPQTLPGDIPPIESAVPTPRPVTPPAGPTPAQAIGDLEHAIRMARMFASVRQDGTVVVVRSATCGDSDFASVLSGASSSLAASGLTKLRCLEQSGRVVFERDL